MKRIPTTVGLLLAAVLLAACSKLTQANYDKIEEGMSKQQVAALLGEPQEASGASFLGLSSGSAVWRDGKTAITVRFLNDKVVSKELDKGQDERGY